MADELAPLRIECTDGTPWGTKVYVGDELLDGVVEVTFHITTKDVARAVLTVDMARADVTLPDAELTYREITATQRDAVPAVEKG